MKKATDPVTVPLGPVRVAVSVIEVWPTMAVVLLTWVVIVGIGKTADALSERSWEPQPKLQES